MTTFVEGRRLVSEAEPVGFLTEGAAGLAVIVLAIIALAGASNAVALTAIAAIVVGVGLMVQGFNTAAENARLIPPEMGAAAGGDFSGEVMVDCLAGGVGIVLGILALIGVAATPVLLPASLIVFGAALLLSGAIELQGPRTRGSAGTGGMEVIIGIAGTVLGILALLTTHSAILVTVGFIAIGAALLMVSATFSGAVIRIFSGSTTA
jgi:uncharacterized membrane protein HdeD (DUF308 family)